MTKTEKYISNKKQCRDKVAGAMSQPGLTHSLALPKWWAEFRKLTCLPLAFLHANFLAQDDIFKQCKYQYELQGDLSSLSLLSSSIFMCMSYAQIFSFSIKLKMFCLDL